MLDLLRVLGLNSTAYLALDFAAVYLVTASELSTLLADGPAELAISLIDPLGSKTFRRSSPVVKIFVYVSFFGR